MGDLSSSDCSWKKIVLAKANNKWSSTIKSKQIEMDNTVIDFKMISEREQISLEKVKDEHDDSSVGDEYQAEIDLTDEQEMDPLSLLQPVKRRRRKSSAGANNELPEARASRLAKMSAYAAARLRNESPEERAKRLKRMSAYAAKRLAHETSEQRAKRLSRMSAYAAKRLANETAEQRQARLARMSAYAARRQATKKDLSSNSSGNPNDQH